MELFRNSLKTVLGTPLESHQPSGAETVEKLVERVLTSTLLDDRRDACRALKALSKKYRVEVGAQAMDAFLQVLEQDRADNEIIGYVLEAICNVISGVQDDDDPENSSKPDENLGFQFTEIFIKKTENVTLLLTLMEEYDFKVRWPVVKLLTALLVHKPKELQDCILVSPMGVSRLMDLLSDTREIIRNDTLLLLAHLTKGNANIQKIVAFENAFDNLLSIIKGEGYSDGGVIVEDCLMVLQTLLKNNSSNQTFFKEGSYIQHLAPFFNIQDSAERGWSPQKTTNIHMMLQVLRVLVSPNNPQQVTLSSQKAMAQCGLLEQLCNILMIPGVTADILTETINTVAEIIRGNHSNQEFFSKFNAPTNPPKSTVVVLLMSMVNEKQPFFIRCAVLYSFQCFLYKNELCQAQIIQTLLPSTTDALTYSMGQLLCGGLFSGDTLSNWFAAVALSHALVDNPTQKEQLLRVQLATGANNPPVSLISQLSVMLQQGSQLQTRLGLLILLSTWLAHCPNAVSQFLGVATNIPFLTSQVGLSEHDESEDIIQGICAFLLGLCIEFNDNSQQAQPNSSKEDLTQIVVRRIGLETFYNKLGAVSKNEYYIRASQNPHLKFRQPNEVLFDYEFCRLFKSLEGVIIKSVQLKPAVMNGPEAVLTPAQQEHLKQYKDLIRDQDMEIKSLKIRLSDLTSEYENVKAQFDDMTSTVQQLRDQNSLLKAQKSVSGNNQPELLLREEIERLRNQLQVQEKNLVETSAAKQQLDMQVEDLTKKLEGVNLDFENFKKIQAENAAAQITEVSPNPFSIEEFHLNDTIGKLQSQVQEQQRQIEEKNKIIDQLNDARSAEGQTAEACKDHESKIQCLEERVQQLQDEVALLQKSNNELQLLDAKVKTLVEEKQSLEEKLGNMAKEQEDMLILLTEHGDKIATYKQRLRDLGEWVEDDDDDDEVGDGDLYEFGDSEDDAKESPTHPGDANAA